MTPDLNLFLQAWTGGGDVSAEECERLLARMHDDASFRDECAAELRLLGQCKTAQSSTPRWLDLSEALGIDSSESKDSGEFAFEVMEQVAKESRPQPGNISQIRQNWRPLAAAAAGLMIGLCSASIVWAVAGPTAAFKTQKVLMEGFESTGLTFEKSFPDQAGIWNGHEATIVKSDSAASGQYVLQFDPKERRKLSHINHIVDVSSLSNSQWKEQQALRLSAKVRSTGEAKSEHRYTLRVAAFAEDFDQLKEQWFSGSYANDTALTFASRSIKTSGSNWAPLKATVPLPPESRYVIISIGVSSPEDNRSFLKHEVDALRLELISSENTLP